MNVEKRNVPNKLVIEVCDQVSQKPDVQSGYWIGVVEVEDDGAVRCGKQDVLLVRPDIASIGLQFP